MALLYLGVVFSAITVFWICYVVPDLDIFATFFKSAIGWVISVFLIYNIGEGRNWARIVFAVLFVLSLPIFIISLVRAFDYSVILDLLSLMNFILNVIALMMLFSNNARPWFTHPPAVPPVLSHDSDKDIY